MSRFNPRDRTFRNYSASDGLLGNEFYGYNTPWKSPRGEMFFGSQGGMIAFYTDGVVDNPYVPPVVLTDFQILGKTAPIGGNSPLRRSISMTDSLTLTHAESIFSFEFSALSYVSPDRNRYRYRLEGLETQWNEVGSDRRFVTYTTLAPGQYVFRVQGSNNRDLWNQKGVTLRLTILPPWWATWWFRAIAGLLVLACLAYYLRLRRIEQRNRRLLQQEKMLRELNLELDRRVMERTAELQQEVERRRSTEAYLRIAATAFECQEGMAVTDAEHVILQVNQAFTAITGYSAEEVMGRKISMLRSDRHEQAFYDELMAELHRQGVWQGEIWRRRKNGTVSPIWLTITAVRDLSGEVSHYVQTLIDITERKAAAEKIERLAFYDPLTGLPNRRLLLDRLQQTVASSARSGEEGALLFLDLDNFKILNDTLGHDIGDLLLQQVTRRLAACVREIDTVARLGGDEFVILLKNLNRLPEDAAAQVKAVCEKILVSLDRPYILCGQEHRSTASIGATLFGKHRISIDDLLKQADIAMYQAKAKGRNTLRFFDPDLQKSVKGRAALEADLRKGIEKHQLLLYYQPQVDGESRVTGAESLLRWLSPERGLTSPAEFISLAEETGLILPIGLWVLETALTQIAAWACRPETAHLTLAINVSARQFRQAEFVDQVLAAVMRTGADPRKLKLELTESLLLDNIEEVIAKMMLLTNGV